MNHRFILEPYKAMDSRFMCPNCRHRHNTFTRYIDTVTQEYLADHVGRCDREESCGYHFTPREFFKTNPDKKPGANVFPPVQPKQAELKNYKVLPWHCLEDTLKQYEHNYFMHILSSLFGEEQAQQLARKYYIGTAGKWYGGNIFWQVDIENRVRTGKIMLYDPETCGRVKEPIDRITWVHSLLMQNAECQMRNEKNEETSATGNPASRFKIKQCLFGEHLLRGVPEKSRIVAIAESEKTAIIASIYQPDYIWLAAGSLDGLTVDKCKVLKDRRVILYPDVNGYNKWRNKANELNARMHTTRFTVNDYLLRTATPQERTRGIDIADRWIDELLAQWEIEKEWGLR